VPGSSCSNRVGAAALSPIPELRPYSRRPPTRPAACHRCSPQPYGRTNSGAVEIIDRPPAKKQQHGYQQRLDTEVAAFGIPSRQIFPQGADQGGSLTHGVTDGRTDVQLLGGAGGGTKAQTAPTATRWRHRASRTGAASGGPRSIRAGPPDRLLPAGFMKNMLKTNVEKKDAYGENYTDGVRAQSRLRLPVLWPPAGRTSP